MKPAPKYIHLIAIKPVGSKIQEHIILQSFSVQEMSENDLIINLPEGITKLLVMSSQENISDNNLHIDIHRFMLGSK